MNTEPNRTPEDLLHTLESLALPAADRERMRAVLSSYADLHAGPVAVPARSFSFSYSFLRSRSLYASAFALVLIVATGAQATSASERALPGDILYPVKVSVAEPVKLALSISSERKAALSAEFASRRVNEAATLSVRGELDEETASELASRFEEHVDTFAKESEALESGGSFAASLAVRESFEHDLSEQVEAFEVAEIATDDVAGAVRLSDAASTFTTRIFLKTQALALMNDHMGDALAVAPAEDVKPVSLAVLRKTAVDVQAVSGARLKTDEAVAGDVMLTFAASMMVGTTSTSTATSTATTSDSIPAAYDASGPNRFLVPNAAYGSAEGQVETGR